MVLPPLGMPYFVDSPKEASLPQRSGWSVGMSEQEKGRDGELGSVYKMKKIKGIKEDGGVWGTGT